MAQLLRISNDDRSSSPKEHWNDLSDGALAGLIDNDEIEEVRLQRHCRSYGERRTGPRPKISQHTRKGLGQPIVFPDYSSLNNGPNRCSSLLDSPLNLRAAKHNTTVSEDLLRLQHCAHKSPGVR